APRCRKLLRCRGRAIEVMVHRRADYARTVPWARPGTRIQGTAAPPEGKPPSEANDRLLGDAGSVLAIVGDALLVAVTRLAVTLLDLTYPVRRIGIARVAPGPFGAVAHARLARPGVGRRGDAGVRLVVALEVLPTRLLGAVLPLLG